MTHILIPGEETPSVLISEKELLKYAQNHKGYLCSLSNLTNDIPKEICHTFILTIDIEYSFNEFEDIYQTIAIKSFMKIRPYQGKMIHFLSLLTPCFIIESTVPSKVRFS